MPEETTIGGSGTLFKGEDKELRFELWDEEDPTVAIDWSGWTTFFDVRKKDTSADPAILRVPVPTPTGVFNPVRASNQQRGHLPLTNDQLNFYRAEGYRWSWVRTDADFATVLAWGSFTPQKATGL